MTGMWIKSLLKRSSLYPYYFARTHTLPAELSGEDHQISLLYSEFVREGSLVFDVGANVGTRTKVFRHLRCRVVAIEPQRNCIAALKHTFGSTIVVVHAAASDREGYADLHASDVTAISSLSSEWVEAAKKSEKFGNTNWNQKERVKLVRLDALIAQYGIPDFIKIDVEGHELSVLRGLSTAITALSFEFTPQFRDIATSCMDRLNQVGEYQFNFSRGDTGEMWFSKWMSSDDFKTALCDVSNYGDVFACIKAARPDPSALQRR
jgi:FkbM family methyltransferase